VAQKDLSLKEKSPPRAKRNESFNYVSRLGELLVETSTDASIAISAKGVILYWNAGAEVILGYTPQEAVGRNFYDLVVPAEANEESRNATRTARKRGPVVFETLRRGKNGAIVYVEVTAKAIRDPRGEANCIALVHKDITQLKVLTHARTLETRYRGLLETVPDAIVMVNTTGRIVLVNSQAEEMFGYSREELLGQPVEILLPTRFRNRHVTHRATYFLGPKTRPMGAGVALYANRKTGIEFPVEISLSPLHTEDGTFAMSAIRDITDRKKMEEQLRTQNEELEEQNRRIHEANRLKSEFLANMSHELRTPLNGIIGFAEIMHDGRVGPISAEHKEYLGDILVSAKHLLQLINDVLDLSKVEAGKMEFMPERIDLAIVVGEVRDIVRGLAAKRRIRLKTEIDPALSGVEADLKSVKQILYNYLSNALKFTPEEGDVTVRVLADEDSEYFRIEVEDTGIGIKTEDMNRLFVEFQQLDSSTAKRYAGTGLGLALTKKIVEAQRGRVGVRSTPGAGSIFYAVLPRTYRSVESSRQPGDAAIPPGASLILVVEDDPSDRAWIEKALGGAGYFVEAVATGSEALTRCREKRYDAITLDIMLPDMSGRAVLAKIRERGLNQQTPVVVVTLLAGKGIMAGFQVADILPKPVSANEILSALRRCGIEPNSANAVLVVDDDEAALKVAEATLTKLGYRAVCEQNAENALYAASKEHPAAVVLDLVMPEIDGFEFLTRFRKTRAGRETPIIVWTGKDLSSEELSRLRSTTTSVLRKTEAADELLEEIKNCAPASKPALAEV
jgi:PAS domain S-box-containing protein